MAAPIRRSFYHREFAILCTKNKAYNNLFIANAIWIIKSPHYASVQQPSRSVGTTFPRFPKGAVGTKQKVKWKALPSLKILNQFSQLIVKDEVKKWG